MWHNGSNYRLTKHGRRRFLERVQPPPDTTDDEMVRFALSCPPEFKFVWVPDSKHSGDFRLVTVLYAQSEDQHAELQA